MATERKEHSPAHLASKYLRLGMEKLTCPHGVDRWAERGQTLVYTSYWVCSCCTHVYPGPSPEGMRCGPCGT